MYYVICIWPDIIGDIFKCNAFIWSLVSYSIFNLFHEKKCTKVLTNLYAPWTTSKTYITVLTLNMNSHNDDDNVNDGDIHNITRIGVFACGQILCISPNGLQASRGINWIWFIPFSHCNKLTWRLHSAIYCIAPWKPHCCSHRNDEIAY